MNTNFFTPLFYIQSDAVNTDIVIASSVIGLFFCCSPFTVAWFVIAVIVYPVYGMLVTWPFAYIGKKIGKTVLSKPPVTNGYAATAILKKSFIFVVVTSVFNITPYPVFSRPGQAMSNRPGFCLFVFNTSARFCMSIANVRKGWVSVFPTLTNTMHYSGQFTTWLSVPWQFFNYCKAAIFVAWDDLFHDFTISRYLDGRGNRVINPAFGSKPSHMCII